MRGIKMTRCKLTLQDVKELIKGEIEMFEMDFDHKKYGEKAKLLNKHYTLIYHLLEILDKKSKVKHVNVYKSKQFTLKKKNKIIREVER